MEGFGMVDINKYSNVPLYYQLKNLILEKIEKGEFKRKLQNPFRAGIL